MSNAQPIQIANLLVQKQASQPRISPDGNYVVFVTTQADFKKNQNVSHLFRVPIRGGEAVQLTREGTINADPAFSPDGRSLAFTSNRSGSEQI